MNQATATQTVGNTARYTRIFLAGPWTLIVAILVMATMATWVPVGIAQIDNLIIPLIVFPLIWTALFFHACLDKNLVRASLVSLAIAVVNGILLVIHFQTV